MSGAHAAGDVVDAAVGDHRARAALRAATDAVHRRLHALPAFAAIVDGTIDVDAYRTLLARLHGFHAPLDALLHAGADACAAYGVVPGSRVAALVDDLRALGVSSAAIARLPRMNPPPARSTAALLGRLYVRDGAMLGGRVLARHLDRLFGASPHGRTFFAGDAAAGVRWRAACCALERVAAHEPDGLAELVVGAHACFAEFERWMT